MDALFGIPMNSIMLVLVVALAFCLATVAYVALRNRIAFTMGVRNIPRRVAQTVLIITGLMLSTLIISAAFTTGDSVDYSVSSQAYDLLGHMDISVEAGSERETSTGVFDEGEAFVSGTRDVPGDTYREFARLVDQADLTEIDGVMGVLYEQAPVINPRTKLSEPNVTVTGLDAERLSAFDDIVSTDGGESLDVRALGPDEAYMNESAADELEATPGDRVDVYVNNQSHTFTVVGIVEDRVLTGTQAGDQRLGMVTRLDAVQKLFSNEDVEFIAVSLSGGVRNTLDQIPPVEEQLRALIKQNDLDLSISDSKADAVGQAEDFGNFMTTFFLLMGLFSIGSGMLLIVMIFVMLAAERKSEMGMARAVGTKRRHLIQMFMAEGMAYNLLSAMIGAVLGIGVAFMLAYAMAAIFSQFGISVTPHVTLRTFVISYSLGVVLTFVTVTFASWRVSNLNIVRAIRDIPEPTGRRMGWRGLTVWSVLMLIGALLFYTGIDSNAAFPFALGFSLVAAGAAVWLRFLGAPERPIFTGMGVLLLVFWGLTAGDRLSSIFGKVEGDVEMFFLSGIAMVTASTYVLIYNSDIVLSLISRIGGAFGSILPAIRTAVAYPLNNRFRTGMTLAMISLVIFALTMMSTMNLNFDRLFLADESRGGWDIQVMENPNNPVADLPDALREAGSPAADEIAAVGRLDLPGRFEAADVRQVPDGEFDNYFVKGADDAFIDNGHIRLNARGVSFENDEEVWQALKTRDDVALLDAFPTESGFGDEGFALTDFPQEAETFDPIPVEIRDPATGNTRELELIGILAFGSSSNFQGLFVNERVFTDVFGDPEFSLHYVSLRDGDESDDVAKEIESSLLTAGAQADSLKKIAEENQALFNNFFRLMQAFMGLGLFVGIAAVGVIAFRTVVERRQQIGMLRAIGYKRGTVALSFLMESAFVTLLGVLSGVGLAIWLSYFLITSDEFPSDRSGYYIPWRDIAFITAFTFMASLLMTWIPSRQAATIPTAEALRYE